MSAIPASSRITIAGAGSVGCYIGGCLALAGRKVSLLARDRLVDPISRYGLDVSDLDGLRAHIPPATIPASNNPNAVLANADVVLVTVKCAATADIAKLIALHAPAGVHVVSFQNGAGNADLIASMLANGQRAIAGMVPFNILQTLPAQGAPRIHRGVSGTALIQSGIAGLGDLLSVPGFPVRDHDNIESVLWSKLLINLNNALNALAGVPLKEEFETRAWRLVLARQIREGLAVLRSEGIQPAPIEGVHPRFLPTLLSLPDFAFKRLASAMLAIDPKARSSMWEDLERGRMTEIDYLQGEILKRAGKHRLEAPQIARVAALIAKAERTRIGSPQLKPQDVRGTL